MFPACNLIGSLGSVIHAEIAFTESVLKPLILFCDWRGLIKESPR
jgi:hypothetical protein